MQLLGKRELTRWPVQVCAVLVDRAEPLQLEIFQAAELAKIRGRKLGAGAALHSCTPCSALTLQ